MHRARAVCDQHRLPLGAAAQHLLELALRVQPWVRDPRRRCTTLRVLNRLERLVTLPPEADPLVHTHVRETNVLSGLERHAARPPGTPARGGSR